MIERIGSAIGLAIMVLLIVLSAIVLAKEEDE